MTGQSFFPSNYSPATDIPELVEFRWRGKDRSRESEKVVGIPLRRRLAVWRFANNDADYRYMTGGMFEVERCGRRSGTSAERVTEGRGSHCKRPSTWPATSAFFQAPNFNRRLHFPFPTICSNFNNPLKTVRFCSGQ